MVTGRDTKTSCEVIGNSPDGSLELERGPVCCNQAVDRKANDQSDIEPIDVFVPVRLRDGLFGDVRLLRIVLLVTIWLGWLCHAGCGWRL